MRNLYTVSFMNVQTLKWKPSVTVIEQPEKFVTLDLETSKLLHLWGGSIVSFEWLKDGKPKDKSDLKESLQEKFTEIEQILENGQSVEHPLLGIGIFDGVEMGTGRATLCVFATHNIPKIKCSILKTTEKEFMKIWKKG